MKWNFLYQITGAEPLPRGLPPPDPLSLCPLSSTEFVEPPEKSPGYATDFRQSFRPDSSALPLSRHWPTYPWFSELVDDYKTKIYQQTLNCRRYGLTTQNSHVQKGGIHCHDVCIKLLRIHSVYNPCSFRNCYFHRWNIWT